MYTNILASLARLSKKISRKKIFNNLDYWLQKKNIKKAKYCLNIGAGGEIEKYLIANEIAFKSVDIDIKRKPDIVADICKMNMIPDSSIQVIFLLEVLEHVKQPQKALKEMHRILEDDGIIIASTPFILGIHDAPYDYYRYTKYGIQYLFRNFEELEIKERNSLPEACICLLFRLYNVGSGKTKLTATILSPIFLFFLILALMSSHFLNHPEVTTGYFYVFRKSEGKKY
ncbi:MAG: methyltransferase domain-containing protein [Verrucomicrobiota bacterium]|nr:methyltransferase domain-containing protein [Verrucomicrobiota bacterium]